MHQLYLQNKLFSFMNRDSPSRHALSISFDFWRILISWSSFSRSLVMFAQMRGKKSEGNFRSTVDTCEALSRLRPWWKLRLIKCKSSRCKASPGSFFSLYSVASTHRACKYRFECRILFCVEAELKLESTDGRSNDSNILVRINRNQLRNRVNKERFTF